jgi:hypothetical protein
MAADSGTAQSLCRTGELAVWNTGRCPFLDGNSRRLGAAPPTTIESRG